MLLIVFTYKMLIGCYLNFFNYYHIFNLSIWLLELWKNRCKTDAQIDVFEQLRCVTYKMLSTLSGLMRIAMGWRPAIWRRFIAFPDTSSMQCLPCGRDTESDILSSHTLALFFPLIVSLSHLVSDLFDRLYAGSIQMVVILSSLDELVLLNLSLHELSGGHEVVISAIHLIVSPWPCCV